MGGAGLLARDGSKGHTRPRGWKGRRGAGRVLGQRRRWARSGRKEGGKVGHGKGERKEELDQIRKEKNDFPFFISRI